MGQAIGEVLPSAIGVAISPVSIITLILLLLTARARSNALTFLIGWISGLAVVGAIVLLADDAAAAEAEDELSTASSAIEVVIGAAFLLFAVWRWKSRPKLGKEPETPKWMSSIDSLTPVMAFGLGVLLSGLNPKNFSLTLTASLAISQAALNGVESAISLVAFIAIASASVAIPVLLYFAVGARSEEVLNRWKSWLTENNAMVLFGLFLILGVALIPKGVAGLAS